jgi:hypothetical protein
MSVMILDAGNSIIKAKIARKEQGEITFPHALRQLKKPNTRTLSLDKGQR